MTEYETARDRAGAALAEFRRRIPLMTGFARSFSGNKRVQIKPSGSGSYTDGDTLYLEVPLKLADKVKHNGMCGEWDSLGFQICPACAIIDDLNYQLFHEISHIWGGSFEKPSDWGRTELKRLIDEIVPKEMIGDASFILQDKKGNDTWLKVAYGIHPFIKELANCFEDARVNTKMAQVRPGVRAWRRAFERRLLVEGIRRFDPRTNQEVSFNPSDAPLNAQMAYSLYFLAAGESVPQGMDKYVVKHLADPRVAELMRDAVGNLNPDKPVQFAVRAYMLMADMGFFGNQDKLQQEQDDQGAPENAGEDEEGEPEESEGNGDSGEGGSPETDEDSDVESYSSEDESEGDGDDSQSAGDPESPGSDSEDSGDAEESGDDGESPGGSGTEPSDDGEASDGDAENPSEDEDSGQADSAHEGEDNPGAGGESSADDADPESDESSDGSNPGDAGMGAQDEEEADSPEGDEASDGSGEDSLGEGGGAEAEDVDDPDGSGEVSDAEGSPDAEGGEDPGSPGDDDSGSVSDEEAGAEGDGPGEGGESGEDGEGESDAADSGDDSRDDTGVDDGAGDGSDSEHADGGNESGDSDASDESEAGSSGGGEDDADDAGQDDNLATGQPGDSTEGEPGDGEDGEAGDGDGGAPGRDDLEAPDGDEVGDGEAIDRSDVGVDEDSDGETSGESDGNEGTHGEGGSSSGIDGQGTSQLSDDDVTQSADEPEEADIAPEESPDDTPDRDADWGDAQEVHERLEDFFGHHAPNEDEEREVIEELERAVNLGDVFDAIPRNVTQVWWHRWQKHFVHPTYGDQATSWTHKISPMYWFHGWTDEKIGVAGDFRVPDTILGKALLRARRAFADNARKKDVRHLKSGRVNARALGKRAPIHDPRLFKKINRPGKRDYFVVIGIDLSASNVYAPPKEYGKPELPPNLALAKRAAMAQCEILARLGVKFAVYGHSCKGVSWDEFAVNMYVIKDAHEPWNEQIRHRLEKLGPDEGNLDGHTLQIYRKIAEKEPATDKIVMYYTDGEIPAANGEEEGEVLVQQIERCKKEDITLMGVGIRTDSLGKFGFDYTRVDTDEDLHRVVDNLEKRLAE